MARNRDQEREGKGGREGGRKGTKGRRGEEKGDHPATHVRPGKKVRQILTGASRHEGRGVGFVHVEDH